MWCGSNWKRIRFREKVSLQGLGFSVNIMNKSNGVLCRTEKSFGRSKSLLFPFHGGLAKRYAFGNGKFVKVNMTADDVFKNIANGHGLIEHVLTSLKPSSAAR